MLKEFHFELNRRRHFFFFRKEEEKLEEFLIDQVSVIVIRHPLGYPLVLGCMGFIAVTMIIIFKTRRLF